MCRLAVVCARRIEIPLVWLVACVFRPSSSSEIGRLGCTALAIDGQASVNGAAFAVENTDCNMCDSRLNYVPPGNFSEGAMRPVFLNQPSYPRWIGYGRGKIYHPKNGEEPREPVAYIPQVRRTFGYYESVNPLMNDQGLGLGESSCGASLQNKQPHSTENRSAPVGILDAMTMMELALERCVTARCAVDTLGSLAEQYGYLPYVGEPTEGMLDGHYIWADSGEAFTIADATGEAWVLNMLGGVEGVVKSVWAAQRVPNGHLAVVSNEFTMGDLPPEPTHDFRFCKEIHRAAIVAGLWDGNGALNFKRTFAPDDLKYQTGFSANPNPPIPLYTALRQWRLLSLAAPSLNLKFSMSHFDLPFSVKVDRPLTHRDVMEFMRDHYGGTEFDMTQGVLAGPFRTPFRMEGGPSRMGDIPRGISIMRTLFSTITQTGPEGSVLWYAPDTPATSVFIPLDSSIGGSVSLPFQVGHHRKFDRSSAWWAFSFVNNWMQINYQGMSSEDVFPRMKSWQDRLDSDRASVRLLDKARVRDWEIHVQEELVADWWQLADHLVMKWNDMSRTDDKVIDSSQVYPQWWAEMVGYSYDIHPIWVRPAQFPPPSATDYVAPTVSLPRRWSFSKRTWADWTSPVEWSTSLTASTTTAAWPMQIALGTGVIVLTNSIAFVMGKKRGSHISPQRQPLLA